MKTGKRLLAFLMCAVMGASLAACGSGSQDTTAADTTAAGTAAVESMAGESSQAEPAAASGSEVELLNVGAIYQFDVESPYCELLKYLSYDSFMYGNLVRYGENNDVVPCLCERFEIAEDGTAVTFYFKDGIKWHDGQPLTMEDIEFSLNLWLNVLKPSVALRYMKSVEVLDENSIRVNMQSSCAYVFLRHMIMSSSGCVIYPKHIWENVEDLKAFTGKEAMIGCGPYRYDSYDEEAKIAYFNRFEDYHEGAPSIKRIAFHLYESPESLVMAYKNKEIDCMFQYAAGLAGTYVPALKELEYLNIGEETNLGGPILEFNFKDALMSDLDIRNAVYHALDYTLIAATDGDEYCKPGYKGVISPGNIGYASDLPQNAQNADEAKRILEEAGYVDVNGDGFRENKDGSEMKIMVSPAYSASKGTLYQRLAQIVVRDLQNVGLNAYLDEEVSNADAWKARFRQNKDFQIAITACSQGVAIIDTVNQGLVEKAGSDGTLTWNGTNATPEYVDIFSKIIDSKNPEEYAAAADESQRYLADNMVAISLGVESMFYPYNTEDYTDWSFRSGNGAFSYDTWFTLKTK